MTDYSQFIQLEFRLEQHLSGSDHATPSLAVWGQSADGRHHPIRDLNDMKLSEFKGSAKKIIGELRCDHPRLKMSFYLHLEDLKPVEGRPRPDGRRLELRSGLVQVTQEEWLDRLGREKVQPEKDALLPRPPNSPRK